MQRQMQTRTFQDAANDLQWPDCWAMRLEDIDASIGQLIDMLQAEPSPNASSLGRALLILQSYSADPSATHVDRANLRVVERGFVAWFDADLRETADAAGARRRLIEDVHWLARPFRERLG
jgi:hypothetical protein